MKLFRTARDLLTGQGERRDFRLRGLTFAGSILFVASNIMNLTYPGPEVNMGEVQRLFYIHLGTFFGAFLTFTVALVSGIVYLRSRNKKWDHLGLASVETGLWLSAATIATGSIWAKWSWGTFWTWDPRLTTVAIMWLTYAAYLFLRTAIEDVEQRRRFAAVYGILAFGSVILTVIIVRVRPDVIHPVVAGPSSTSKDVIGSFDITPRITQTVLFSIFTYVVISITLLWHRVRLEDRKERLQARKMEILGGL